MFRLGFNALLFGLLCIGCSSSTSTPITADAQPDQSLFFVDSATDAVPDQATTDSAAGDVLPADSSIVDAGAADSSATDLINADLPSDSSVADAGIPQPVTKSQIQAAFGAAMVPCIDNSGQVAGPDIPLVDSTGDIKIRDACGKIPPQLLPWIQSSCQDAVIIVWDPNSCGDEFAGSEWDSACIIARNAQRISGDLVLSPGVTVDDFDVHNCQDDGDYENQVFGLPDNLTNAPQIEQTVLTAKQLLIQISLP